MLTDTVKNYGGWMLRQTVKFPGKELVGFTVTAWSICCLYDGSCKANAKCLFHFFFFFVKVKILLRFLVIVEKRVLM